MATAQVRLREFLPNARELALLFAARGLACVAAWESGFRALSDDDYARISIAQGFAQLPRLDPTGTSWLPAPFWAYGAAFRLFGHGLEVARATAIAASLAATVLVYVAARLLGAGAVGAILAGAMSCLLVPYSACLGLAAVPEVPCAALSLLGAACLARAELRLRAWGALALLAACLSRYEVWPIAFVFFGFTLCDVFKRRGYGFVGCALLAIAGPALWILLGRLEHGHAFFFVARVTDYRKALGGAQASLLQRLIEYPKLLLLDAPAVLGPLLVLPFLRPRTVLTPYVRSAWALLAMLAFLMLGSVRGGVPTHHAGRVLLPIWFFGCVACGNGIALAQTAQARRGRWAPLVLAVFFVINLFNRRFLGGFAERSKELEAGSAARQFTSSNLAIDTPDYGYTAVQAAFGTPISTRALDEHDPRHSAPDPFASPQALETALREHGARFVLVTTKHAPLLADGFTELWRSDAFVLFAWKPRAQS
ncbi:MAG: hypothetical protein ABI548_13010 [Polyangiaceae bacterium]